MDIEKVIGLEGGNNATWFKVLGVQSRGTSKHFPAIVDGVERGWSEFRSLDDYMAAKVETERKTVTLTVAGNAVAAEDVISAALGVKAMAVSPTAVHVYPDSPLVDASSAAAALGSMTSKSKAEASRRNGQKGGRPRKK